MATAVGTRTALFGSGLLSGGFCLLVVFLPGAREPERILGTPQGTEPGREGLD